MSSQDADFDAWTSMPVEGVDTHVEPLSLPVRKGHPSRFDIGSFFWKYVAAGSVNTAPAVLTHLATDESAQIRKRVAENANTPADALSLLCDDSDASIRASVARNRQTPVYLLRKLAADDNVEVRFAIAANAAMPDAILLSLFLDPDPYVAERASQTLAA